MTTLTTRPLSHHWTLNPIVVGAVVLMGALLVLTWMALTWLE